jgi:hypothetical protein
MAYIGSPPASQAFAPGTDTFSGTGSQTAFNLSRNVATVNDILVVVNNVDQQPTAYSVASNVLTFTAAPSSGTANIYVRYLSTNLQTIAPQQGSVTPASLSTPNALYWDTSGDVGVGTTSPNFSGYGTTNLTVSGGTTIQGVLELVGTRADGNSFAAGDINFFANSNSAGNKRIAAIQSLTDGVTANNRGGNLVFNTKADNGSLLERMRVLSTGNILSLSGGSTTATGTGIAFPATQASSSDVNTLDDYEEGTWTPVLVPSAGTITGQSCTGSYTKIGRQVTIWFQATINSGTITTISGINNLPFIVSVGTYVGVARENAATGILWQLLPTPSFTMTFYNYANSTGCGVGYSWLGTATYFTST